MIEYLDIFNGYPFGYFQGDFLQSLHGQMFPISQEDQYIYRNTDTKMSQIEEEKNMEYKTAQSRFSSFGFNLR